MTDPARRHDDRPRILHVINSVDVGGAETALLSIVARTAEQLRHELLTLVGPGSLADRFREAGAEVSTLSSRHDSASIRGALSRADLVQGWLYWGNLAALVLGRRTRVLWSVRSSWPVEAVDRESWKVRCARRLCGLASRWPAAVCYNSEEGRRSHERRGFFPRRAKVLRNGVDGARFRPRPDLREATRRALGLRDDDFAVGLFGRTHPVKGHEDLLRAAAGLTERIPGLVLVLPGRHLPGTLERLEEVSRALGIASRTLFLGPRDDLPELYDALDVYCSASWREGCPNAILEALASGVPCVATDAGDSAAVVGDAGRIVPTRRPRELAEAIAEIHDLGVEGRRSLGAEGRRHVVEEFDLRRSLDLWVDLYRSLVGPAR